MYDSAGFDCGWSTVLILSSMSRKMPEPSVSNGGSVVGTKVGYGEP